MGCRNEQRSRYCRVKKVLTKWQKGLEGKGWNALFIENHDKPRICFNLGK